jgi:hypothetical protein
MKTLIEKLKALRLYFVIKRVYHGYFTLINGTKQFPKGSLIEANMYAYNYLHYRIKVLFKYGNCECKYWERVGGKRHVL